MKFVRPCPVCDGYLQQSRPVWLFRCSGCGLLASDLRSEIPEESGTSTIDEESRLSGLAEIRGRNNAAILDALTRTFGPKGTLLDVGSGLGFFLRDASNRGFSVTGIEPDGNVIGSAKQWAADVRHGFFPDCLENNEKFDVIIFNDVLEHIPDALSTVRAAAEHLNNGGVLILNCPDRRGLFYRSAFLAYQLGFEGPFDRMWQRGLPSPHVWYFTADDLVELGRRNGLAYLTTTSLKTISFKGLVDRVRYARNQSLLTNVISIVAAVILLPLTAFFQSDLSVVFLRKSAE